MAEIYRDSTNVGVEFSVPSAIVNGAKVFRRGDEYSATHCIHDGRPVIVVPYDITRYDGKFDVIVDYEIDGKEYKKSDTHEVVTPLFTIDELRGFDSDFNAVSESDIINLEVIVRSIFETLTGQRFGLEKDTVIFPGSGSQMVGLPKRAVEVWPFEGNKNSISAYGWTNIRNDGWVLTTSPRRSWIDKFEPDHYHTQRGASFRADSSYALTGLWGYNSPPEDISLAAKLLAQDYGCDQTTWRDRWIKSIRAADWRIEFNSSAYLGTGNVKVDQILDRYTLLRMVVL